MKTLFAAVLAGMLAFAGGAGAFDPGFASGVTTRVSVNSDGQPASWVGQLPPQTMQSAVLSADGRYVVFSSNATNLGAGGQQVYRHDRATGETVLVSVAMGGGASAGMSMAPTVSEHGRYVAFASMATDLVAGDSGVFMDVFVRDMVLGTTVVASSSGGVLGNANSNLSGLSGARALSDDGRYVVFTSSATNLVSDANGWQQVYRKDLVDGTLVRVSVANDGSAGDRGSSQPVISGDGRFVAFRSESTNLSPQSTSGTTQVFVRDLVAETTSLESVTSDELVVALRASTAPALSSDGRFVAFESTASLDARDRDNGTVDVFLRDRMAGTTVLASLSDLAVSGAPSTAAAISGDGRYVAFQSLDDTLLAGDANALIDVFVYDRTSEALTLASLNDAGDQAIAPSVGPSLSSDGKVVLFASTAANLVSSPASTGNQLYVRDLAPVVNVAPTVTLPGDVDLTFSATLYALGTFTDSGGLAETYEATVDYGDGSGVQTLALGPYDVLAGGSFTLHHTYAGADSYTVTVTVSDSSGGSTTATLTVNVRGYTYQWLGLVSDSFVVGRNLPVKFAVYDSTGAFVDDATVRVEVRDTSGTLVAGPYLTGDQPSRSVAVNDEAYHVNVDTRNFDSGVYTLRVSFSSLGGFSITTSGTNGTIGLRTTGRH